MFDFRLNWQPEKNGPPPHLNGFHVFLVTTSVKLTVMHYPVFEQSIYFGLLKIQVKLKSRGFLASGLSTYDFSTLYTTLPRNLINEKLTELIEQTFNRGLTLFGL